LYENIEPEGTAAKRYIDKQREGIENSNYNMAYDAWFDDDFWLKALVRIPEGFQQKPGYIQDLYAKDAQEIRNGMTDGKSDSKGSVKETNKEKNGG
jgi:hypothetical protein